MENEALEARLRACEAELHEIRQRNLRVEADKAWETSGTRICAVAAVTYLLGALLFLLIDAPHPLRNALVPTLGYVLSTRSLPAVRRWWQRRHSRMVN